MEKDSDSVTTYPNDRVVEITGQATGRYTMLNKRHPYVMLVFTKAEMEAFIKGVKDGEFDYLI